MHWHTPRWVIFAWWLLAILFGLFLGWLQAATLTWTYTQDPSAPAVAIEIERRDPGQTFQLVGETGPDIATFVDGTKFPAATCWRVRARGEGAWSLYSNTVCLPSSPAALMVK